MPRCYSRTDLAYSQAPGSTRHKTLACRLAVRAPHRDVSAVAVGSEAAQRSDRSHGSVAEMVGDRNARLLIGPDNGGKPALTRYGWLLRQPMPVASSLPSG